MLIILSCSTNTTRRRQIDEYVSREYLLKEYDKQHKGPAGRARKIIEDAPTMVESGPTDTVWLTVPDINVVARVILQEPGSTFCKVLYVYESEAAAVPARKRDDMVILIDGNHLYSWILARWKEIDQTSEYPLKASEITEQIGREMDFFELRCKDGKFKEEVAKAINVTRGTGYVNPVRCNQCRYYEGVHGVPGHAPCSFWKSGGVMHDWYCSAGRKGTTMHRQNKTAEPDDFMRERRIEE